ncbi:WD40/YVTN/BNR-like repeat-containing protein [Limnoglobus roseus]|uniref:Exo-alpha-sialidase n=1 Tax=Limnoglobus roseus TaxID=2598579 RepID=A0A5C1A7I4_9BACT|nr:hypothetical protein [Limnoglobus roseus]QEL13802.1 exo-alpha-sialidase [Limnoglobus roseus]
MRLPLFAAVFALASSPAVAQDWQPVTTALLQKEKPGYGGLCGVTVDHATGDVYVNVSDRGVFRSTDQGKTWERLGKEPMKGRTETPGCLQLDPAGKTKRLVMANVYGGPIAATTTDKGEWRTFDKASVHVDWFALDWTDPEMKFVLTLKHESGDLLLKSRDGGKTFTEVGKGYGPAWVFDADTAVVALAKSKDKPKGGVVRTTDGGTTFTPVAEFTPKALPRWHGDTLYWLADGALFTTTDRGATWAKRCDLKDGRFGPVFGKDAKHLFVLTNAGVVESTDAGTTWTKPVAVPKELKGVSPLTWLDYDPIHDVVYVMKMTSELYQIARGKK